MSKQVIVKLSKDDLKRIRKEQHIPKDQMPTEAYVIMDMPDGTESMERTK